mgnify:CR=1 FL=1
MTDSQLVPVVPGTIGNVQCLTVDGRTLHGVLGVRRDFSTWMKGRISKYGFVQGQDFEVFTKMGENSELDSPNLGNQKNHGGDRRSIEYRCSLDMGKELCMVENNEQGRIARRYFIECERRLMESFCQPVASPQTDEMAFTRTLTPAERAELKALVDAKLSMVPAELQRKARGEVWTRFNRHFRIPEYALLPAERMSEARDYLIEMQPKALRALPKAEAMPAPLSMPETHAHRVADMSPMEHVASIRELTRRIHDHEAALWGAVRRSLPSGRVGAAYVASGWMLDTMRSSFEALEANLDGIKASAHAILALGQA